jgi:cytochrome c-type biogenesis protein CcmH
VTETLEHSNPVAPAARRRRPWLGPLALVVVLAVALVVGSGVGGHPATAAQRAEALDAQLRCPSCEDVSVADSGAASAVAVRRQVLRLVQEGSSDQAIEASLEARYGPTILLRPPARGLTSLVWLLPALAGGAAVVGLVVLFSRRSRSFRQLREEQP